MYRFTGKNQICGYQGDTGGVAFRAAEDGLQPQQDDLLLFTVARPRGGIVIQKVIAPQDGVYRVPIVHGDTRDLMPGEYVFEARLALGAKTNAQGQITGMRELDTKKSGGRFVVKEVKGRI